MASYRVVLHIDVSDDDVVKNCGVEALAEMSVGAGDYLRAHVEHEIGWLDQSFSRVETQSVTRVRERKQGLKRSKPTSRKPKS